MARARSHRHEPVWEFTKSAEENLRGDPRFEEPDLEAPHGWYLNRRIIGRDTPINGGVYIVPRVQEAIVVDDTRFTEEYERTYLATLDLIYSTVRRNPQASVVRKVLMPVFSIVEKALPYDSAFANEIATAYRDRKVNLGDFIRTGAGVCRHQALMSAYLLERLKKDRELSSKDRISIDRNYIPGQGGHAWVRFTASNGTPYILDPAQRCVDRLSHLIHSASWEYRRPEEL